MNSLTRGPTQTSTPPPKGRQPMEPLAVDVPEASRLTSLSPFTIRAYVRSGKLQATRCGRRLIISVEELRRLVREGCTGLPVETKSDGDAPRDPPEGTRRE